MKISVTFEPQDSFILHQSFAYIVRFGKTVGVQLMDDSLIPRWRRVLSDLIPGRKVFASGPAWFAWHNGVLSGPFQDIDETKRFLMF